jgi:phosphoadenylyl-sulfate reductase (thioredoxin)
MRLLEPGTDPATPLDSLAGANQSDLAVEMPGDTPFDTARDIAGRAKRIDIRFPKFRDGRGFSLGALLRERAQFKGELRAVGDVLPDQVFFLKRVGFDSIAPEGDISDEEWKQALNAFSVVYQPAPDGAETVIQKRADRGVGREVEDRLKKLNERFRGADATDIIRAAWEELFPARLAVMSSFGAEAAVSLHLAAQVDPNIPVLFLDTDRHFAQTEQYRKTLTDQLGLKDVRIIRPDEAEAAEEDPNGDLWRTNPDACCALRKVRPLAYTLGEYDALITGRKRFQGGTRVKLPIFEFLDGRYRINPMADWSQEQVQAYFKEHELPEHPLLALGYRSIGCWPCTQPSNDGGVRSGRWAGSEKTECGIHFSFGDTQRPARRAF